MTSKAARALLTRIVEVAGEHADERSYIATSRLSTPVHSEHIDVLSQSDGAFASAEALAAAVELSKLVDCVQDGSLSYSHPASVGASFVTNVYKNVASDIEFARAPLTTEQKADLERAEAILYLDAPFVRTEEYTQFAELRVEVASQEIDRAETERALQQANEAEKELVAERLEAIDTALQANRSLLAALDAQHGFTRAEETYNGAQVAGFPPKLDKALDMLGDPAFEITNPISNETHWPAAFFPNLLTEENWIPIKLTHADIASAGEAASGKLPDLPQAAQELALNDDAVDLVELEVQVLRVDRPWMWSGIFENKQWRFRPGVEPFSNGKPDAIGQLPAFVTGLIFARNLRLSGRKNMVGNMGTLKFKPLSSVSATTLVAPTLKLLAPAIAAKPTTSKPTTASVQPKSAFTIKRPMMLSTIVGIQRIVVSGKMVDNKNKPIDNVNVTLSDPKAGIVLKGKSDKKGNVVFRLAEEGTYVITANKKGFKTFKTRMRLGDGGNFKAVVEPQFGVNIAATVMQQQLMIAPKAGNTLTVKLRKRDADGTLKPLDVPAQVVVFNSRTRERHPQNVKAGHNAVFSNLAKEKYNVSVHCAVYEPEGTASRHVDASKSPTLEFAFRTRTILQSEDTFLFGFLCYRTPRSPSPSKSADFGD